MNRGKLIIGIISIVLSGFIFIQSSFAFLGDMLMEEGGRSGLIGILVGVLMLMAGITAIVTRKNIWGTVTVGVMYGIAGLIAIGNYGVFTDLIILGGISLSFAVVFFISGILIKKEKKVKEKGEV